MSDDKDPLAGLGDLDWDSALDEWEKNTFVPEVARDADTNRVAAPLANEAAAKPVPAPPRPAAAQPPPAADVPPSEPGLKVNPTGTLIAPVPRELRDDAVAPARASTPPRASDPPPRASSPPARGGLNQLFSRPPPQRSDRPPGAAIPRPAVPAPRAPSEKTKVAPPIAAPRREPASVTRQMAADGSPGRFPEIERPTQKRQNVSGLLAEDLDAPVSVPISEQPLVHEENVHDARTSELPAASQGREDAPTVATRDLEALAAQDDDETVIRDRPNDHETVIRESPSEDETVIRDRPRMDGSVDRDRDDDNETAIFDRPREPRDDALADAETATRLPAGEPPRAAGPASTRAGSSAPAFAPPADEMSAPETVRGPSVPPGASRLVFQRDHARSPSLDKQRIDAFAARIAWLEEEAHALEDSTARARALLAVSELCALTGDKERALECANAARELAPHHPLVWRQARQLMPADPDLVAEALDAEASRSPTPSARAHAVLLAADVLRLSGQGDAAVERWESACKLDPADARGPIARAALALAQDDHNSGALRLSDNSELVALDKAVATALRLRGVERPGSEVEDLPVNDGLRHARTALASGDVVTAAQSIGELATVPELTKGAHWLSASLGAGHIASRRAAARSLKALANEGDSLARRQLAARGIELGDPELVKAARSDDATFEPAERAILDVLGSKNVDAAADPEIVAALAEDEATRALADALTSLSPVVAGAEAHDRTRAFQVSGSAHSRSLASLGRVLACGASAEAIDDALGKIPEPRPASAGGVAIEAAVRTKRWDELSGALSSLPSSDGTSGGERHVAAAIVAERAGNRERAREAWGAAARDPAFATDGVLRIAADLDPSLDLGRELLRASDAMPDAVASAILRLEGLARTTLDDAEQREALERVHHAAPTLGFGSFLAERIGRRTGDLDEVLRWIHERRSYATDPLETALDAVREALLVADRDPDVADRRLEEAHRARPDDVALRELHERLAPEPPPDRGTWRESRAAKATGASAAVLWVEAAIEHDRMGDMAAALRAARKAAEAGDRGLSKTIIERAELETGDTTRQTDALLAVTKSEDELERREAFERLAELDAFGKKDAAAAMLWHRAILEATPLHKPSLRWVEHALISESRDDELPAIFEQIARALDGTRGGETTAHAEHAARLRVREAQAALADAAGAWEKTHDMARLAATQPEPSLWALRALNAHARTQMDDTTLLSTTLALLERTQRQAERATLLVRASEAAGRLEKLTDARSYLEQAASEDPGDVVTWGLLAEMRQRADEAGEAAEACESLARTSVVKEHQLLAWHDAAKIWLEEVNDTERAMGALEAAAEIDVTYADVFARLSALYADKDLDAELARLLEKRLESVDDEEERVVLEVELSRALADMGELAKAKSRLESALERRPDHTTALAALADLCIKEGDWNGAEHAYVRLARLTVEPTEQRAIYERLAEIYTVHAPNLSRAEVALKEVLKRSPNDVGVLATLVDVYRRQGDVQRAVESQQEIVAAETDPNARLAGLIELAKIHETIGRDPRRSEQVLDSARKEFPTSVIALRAMAEFYSRQKQLPAMQILLDRAAGDARRAFAQGRFVPSLFQVLHAAFELRGKRDAARVVAATLAAVEGESSDLIGGDARAVDPQLDELLAPDLMAPALRALLFRTGDTLDAVAPLDLRILKAAPLPPGTPIGATVGSVATVVGLGALQILVSPVLDRVALPLSTNPPTLLVGEGLAKVKNERARMFVVVRAMKMMIAKASAMLREQPQEVPGLIAGLFNALNPSYVPQGVDAKRVAELSRRIGAALPRNLDPTVGVIALEAAGMLGTQWPKLGPAAHAWANRVALLAVGDPNAALDAIAWGHDEDAAPTGSEERAAWIARHPDARELMTFSVTDAYAEARIRLGLDR